MSGAFYSHAKKMRQAGFGVLPAFGKTPLMKGFNKWESAPGSAAVEKWANKHPHADLVYLPGLSRAEPGGDPIVVVDADDLEAVERVVSIFGDTPGKVKTRRGKHFLYRDAEGSGLGNIVSLKKFGLNADVKHGRSIVVAPPSLHEKERSFSYQWDSCDETVIRDLPPFNMKALQGLTECRSETLLNTTSLPPPRRAPLWPV